MLEFHDTLRTLDEIMIAVILGLIAYVLFGPVQRSVEKLVDRFVFRDRYDYRQVIKTLTDSLNTLDKFNDISQAIIGTMLRTLNIAGACLFIYAGDALESSTAQGTFANKIFQKRLVAAIPRMNEGNKFPGSASPLGPGLSTGGC